MALLFTILATLSNTAYLICQEKVGKLQFDPIWGFRIGATVIFVVAWTITFPTAKLVPNRSLAVFTMAGVIWSVLIGISASGIDINTIIAFYLGIDLSTCGPIIEIVSAAILCLVGIWRGEGFHYLKIACLLPMFAGGIGLILLYYKGIIR